MTDSRIRKSIAKAQVRARRETPKPNLLTWCLRKGLHKLFGWTPYY